MPLKKVEWTPHASSNTLSQDIEYQVQGATDWTLHLNVGPTVNATNGTTIPHLELETFTTYNVRIITHCKMGGKKISKKFTINIDGVGAVDCLDGLTIETIYLHSNSDLALLPSGYTHPKPSTVGVHSCNRALFEVYGNGIYVGESKLNNLGTPPGMSTCVTPRGTEICKDFQNKPNVFTNGVWTGHHSSRYSIITLSQAQAISIAQASNNGNDITFTLVGAVDSYNCGCGGDQSHLEATWVRIKRADGALIYNNMPVGNIATINVCAPGG